MNIQTEQPGGFGADSRECFENVLGWLEGQESAALSHGELEAELGSRGRELLRRMLQDHLSLRTKTEPRLQAVADEAGTVHAAVEAGHRRKLASVFGTVEVERLAYRHRGHSNLYPADAALNLPAERHCHGLPRLAAVESSRGSFAQAGAAIGRASGAHLATRQVEELAARAAADVEGIYSLAEHTEATDTDVLVISTDGQGLVMRPDSLRAAAAKAAAKASTKLATRLSKGEKRNRKRLAEVGAVYDLRPVARAPTDVLAGKHGHDPPPPAPVARNKWLTASVVEDAAEVVAGLFDQAQRRDPSHRRTWMALVEGNNHQIQRVQTEAANRGITVHILLDIVHVLEYIWAAAWCFFDEADPEAEEWVRQRTLAVLEGQALQVTAGIRRRATAAKFARPKRAKADACAEYHTNKAAYLDYPTALAAGWPIATGDIPLAA